MNAFLQNQDPLTIIIAALRQRHVSFRVIQSVMRDFDSKVTSWDELATDINKAKDIRAVTERLSELLRENYYFWDQVVQFYEIAPEVAKKVRKLFNTSNFFMTEGSVLEREAFPFLISEADLATTPHGPVYIETKKVGSQLTALFSWKRFYTDRLKRDFGSLNNDQEKRAFETLFPGNFDVVVATRRVPYQVFFSLTLTDEDTLELRIDATSSHEENMDILHAVKSYFNKRFDSIGEEDGLLQIPQNLFPAIKKLYAAKDGVVSNDQFATGSGMVGNNKMRFSNSDVRSDTYHAEGEKAASHTLKHFGIVKSWELHKSRKSCQPTLALHASAVESQKKKPYLGTVYVLNCSGEADYKYLRKKLLSAAGL